MMYGAALRASHATSGRRARLGALLDRGRVTAGRTQDIRIGLLEHTGSGNLGDDATVAAVIQQIAARRSDASIVCLSLDPGDSERRHGVRAFPIRRNVFACEKEWSAAPAAVPEPTSKKDRIRSFLRTRPFVFNLAKLAHRNLLRRPAALAGEIVFLSRSLRVARELDILVICGGGQLLDWGGPWAFPYTIFKWVLLAKCAGAECIFLNNGAGPLDSSVSRWLVVQSLRLADYVSFRDGRSESVVRKIGYRGPTRVSADCAWGLALPDALRRAAPRRSSSELVIGMAPMAYCDPTRHWVKDEARYRDLVRKLAMFGSAVLARGYRLSLFSSDIWFDLRVIADLRATIAERCSASERDRIEDGRVTTIDEFLARLSRVDCYVTCRFHGVVLAHLLDVSTLAISPHPKVSTLMAECGLSDYCVDIEQCDAGDLMCRLDRVITNQSEIKLRRAHQVTSYGQALTTQFDELFSTRCDSARAY